MTVPRMAVAAAVAVGAAALAWVLAGSVVPNDLSLPNVDVDAEVSVLEKRDSPVPVDGGDDEPVTVPSILLDLNADLGDILGQIRTFAMPPLPAFLPVGLTGVSSVNVEVAVSVDGTDGVAVTLNIELLTQLLEDVQNLISDAIADLGNVIANVGLVGLVGGALSSLELCGTIITLLNASSFHYFPNVKCFC